MKRSIMLTYFILLLSVFLIGCANKTDNSSNSSNSDTESVASASDNSSTTSDTVTSSDTSSDSQVFTVDDLKNYDGQNGNPAYVAVNGVVYDVTNSKEWKDGKHQGLTAGADLTSELENSPHGDSVLKDLPVVGSLE